MDLYTENMNGRPYGATIPRKGRELIAKILAAKLPLTLTRIMVGTGMVPDGIFPGELTTRWSRSPPPHPRSPPMTGIPFT